MMINTTNDLKELCERLSEEDFVAVDTEFIREHTFWPIVCLIQIASLKEAHCIDPLAKDMDMTPLFDLMSNEKVLKVFHAGRQDLEIFYQMMGHLPSPIFDTQVGCMVCGLGDNAAYQNLVSHYLKRNIDKSLRFTDWSHRPLTEKQMLYALSDVTHLAEAYVLMRKELNKSKRMPWIESEIARLLDESTYQYEPQDAWKRLRYTSAPPRFLGVVRALCAWREEKAKRLNRPRKHILKDEVLMEIAALAPTTKEGLGSLRSVPHPLFKDGEAQKILSIIADALKLPEDQLPVLERGPKLNATQKNIREVLYLVLAIVSEDTGVSQKLLISNEDLDWLSTTDTPDIPAMKGWRFKLFGKKALDFKHGKLALFFNPETNLMEFIEK